MKPTPRINWFLYITGIYKRRWEREKRKEYEMESDRIWLRAVAKKNER